jgi:DNA-binding SARP family transcriptional activator
MNEPHLHFRVLGSVDLRRADGSRVLSFLAQPKRVALLAYVALEAPGGFVPRERIMSVLWPDSDNTRARQSLRNGLYQIRQSTGSEVLVNRGSVDVGVDLDLLFVDAVALRAAVAEGRFQDAVDLYGGPLLSSFHLDDAPEFEEWAARARALVEADALRAFREAARAQEASGEAGAGVRPNSFPDGIWVNRIAYPLNVPRASCGCARRCTCIPTSG